jgi:hypothetical protein
MSGIQAALEYRQLHTELEAARRSGDVARMERASGGATPQLVPGR